MRSSAMPLVVRRKEDSLRRYCYRAPATTATRRLGLGPLTRDPAVDQDLTRLFKQLSGCAPKSAFRRPRNTRPGFIEYAARSPPHGNVAGVDQNQCNLLVNDLSMRSASTPCTAPARPARASTASCGTPQPQARYPRR